MKYKDLKFGCVFFATPVKCKSRLTNNTINDGTADVEVAVSLECLGHFGELLNCP